MFDVAFLALPSFIELTALMVLSLLLSLHYLNSHISLHLVLLTSQGALCKRGLLTDTLHVWSNYDVSDNLDTLKISIFGCFRRLYKSDFKKLQVDWRKCVAGSLLESYCWTSFIERVPYDELWGLPIQDQGNDCKAPYNEF